MAGIAQVFVHVDTDTFAIEKIQYQPPDVIDPQGNPVEQTKVNVEKFEIDNSEIDNLYNHADPTFDLCIVAVEDFRDALIYLLDGNTARAVNLKNNIENTEINRCIFSQLLEHDPIYCEVRRRQAQKVTEFRTFYQYIVAGEKPTTTDVYVEAESFEARATAVSNLGVFESEAEAYTHFTGNVANAGKTPALLKYCVKAGHISGDPNPFKARVLLMPSGLDLEGLQVCLPVQMVTQ